MSGFSKEMQRALKADGEKLKAMTGEDHGPVFFTTCTSCWSAGGWEKARPQHDDPHYTIWVKCDACNGSGWVVEG
jgi:DnaJ-class molecular chaperone